MSEDIQSYNKKQNQTDLEICKRLMTEIDAHLPGANSKVWHGHPVWFLEGNPIVGYSKQKAGIRLMFWSGQDFDEHKLDVRGKNFKDASKFYNDADEINSTDLKRWLKKSIKIQWDYKNIVKHKGLLKKLT